MDTYFFDEPAKAIMKAAFLLITYLGSILFESFTIPLILPTVLIYFLSNVSDYAELAFSKCDKVAKIRLWSFVIFLAMILVSICTFCVMITDNRSIISFVNKYYYIFYLLCATTWMIPLIDGIRGQWDRIKNSSKVIEGKIRSDRAYEVVKNDTSKSS